MKPKLLLLYMFIFFGINILHSQDNNSYYYQGEKVYIEIDYTTISIVSKGEFDLGQNKLRNFPVKNQTQDYTKEGIIKTASNSKSNMPVFYCDAVVNKKDSAQYFDLIKEFETYSNVLKASSAYLYNGKKMSLSNYFYVKLFNPRDIGKLTELADKYGVEIEGHNPFMPLWYTLSCSKKVPYNTLEIANLFYESNLFECAEPEFLHHNLLATNDIYFDYQWGLKNTGQNDGIPKIDINAEKAWTFTVGSSNIKVAIFDEGIEMTHPDMSTNIYGTGYDTKTGDTVSVVRGNHGTACAGIVGAIQNNYIGVTGVSPSSKLISISIDFSSVTNQQLANGFNWAWQNGADVISNSWGGGSPSSVLTNAIQNALEEGRNGKGTVVVFSTGNSNTAVSYPANALPLILAVGALSPCGERKNPNSCDGEYWWGSNYGNQLDIMAPGVFVPTTDRQGASGYTDSDYVLDFNGTSAACPHVSGVAALILSMNSDLTVQEVNDIIEKTARKVGNYSYTDVSGRGNGSWNNQMGYGVVDAYKSVLYAQAQCVSNDYITSSVNENYYSYVSNSVVASSQITENLIVGFYGETIVLKEGFKVNVGQYGTFVASTNPCVGYESVNYVPFHSSEENVENITNVSDVLSFAHSAILKQNDPNPFVNRTQIAYVIPDNSQSAYISVCDIYGRIVKRFDISGHGQREVILDGFDFKTGIYMYFLVVDDIKINTKYLIKK